MLLLLKACSCGQAVSDQDRVGCGQLLLDCHSQDRQEYTGTATASFQRSGSTARMGRRDVPVGPCQISTVLLRFRQRGKASVGP